MNSDDALWPEFMPLWIELRATAGALVIAGGYGLFLKQVWLSANPGVPIIVSLGRWEDAAPRTTKDVDLVIGLDLIAEQGPNQKMASVLHRNGYSATEHNPRWQFRKSIRGDRGVIVDIHVAPPSEPHPNLSVDRIRVKHKPSLGQAGVHGRTNPEADGGLHLPFRFDTEGVEILVPNPVTWSMMKLTAMCDCWGHFDQQSWPAEKGDFWRNQAIKHARDVCRVVAMVTLEERDQAAEVLETIDGTVALVAARQAFAGFFQEETGRGTRAAADSWKQEDLQLIRSMLAEWFG